MANLTVGAIVTTSSSPNNNLVPPVSVYNSSILNNIITLSCLPLGINAIIINSILIAGIINYVSYRRMPNRPSFSLYLHISIMDLLNGVSGVILAGFLLQNLSDFIDPNAAGEFCKWFAPAPKCIIRVVLFLMTLLSALRVSIVANQGLSQWTNFRINICIIFAYLCGVVYIYSFIPTSYKSMALPDGWCVYLTDHNLTAKDKFFTILLDASLVVICSLFIIGCHA